MNATATPFPAATVRHGALVLALALGAPAWAQSPCAPMDAASFSVRAEEGRDAMLNDDPAAHAAMLAAVGAGVPCLTEGVDGVAWARILYQAALFRYAEDRPWEALVAAALAADPALDRSLGPPATKEFMPPAQRGDHTVPAGVGTVFLNGREVSGAFDLDGLHILQVRERGVWRSWWISDGRLPEALRAAPPPEPEPEPEPAPEPEPIAEVPPPIAPAERPAPSAFALRVHAATGLSLAVGKQVVQTAGTEPALKLVVPVELGIGLDVGPGWLRLAGAFLPLVNGPYVYDTSEGAVATRIGGGLSLSGGGRIGIGTVGALVGGQDPSRLVFQFVGGVEAHKSGLGVEARAGINLRAGGGVEPAFALLLVVAPKVWKR